MKHEQTGHETWAVKSPRTGEDVSIECGFTVVGESIQWSAKVSSPGSTWHPIDDSLALPVGATEQEIADFVKEVVSRRALVWLAESRGT